jgi:V/A-type H+-transporting ATPase subunit D
MARHVSPNRMELMNLKKELQIARRGHSLLKDKRDGLMQAFLALIEETLAKREEVDLLLGRAADAMAIASSMIEPEVLLQSMQLSTEPLEVEVETKSVMAVQMPEFKVPQLETIEEEEEKDFLGYGMAQTTGDIDQAFESLSKALEPMLELANLEKKVQVMAHELEITRRRVNSLEHVLIPEIEETIYQIEMKMEENERQNIVRLMKVKDIILEEERQKKLAQRKEQRLETELVESESLPDLEQMEEEKEGKEEKEDKKKKSSKKDKEKSKGKKASDKKDKHKKDKDKNKD